MDEVVKALTDFISASDISVVLKIVLGLGIVAAGFYLKKYVIKAARQSESDKDVENRKDMTKENKKENEQAKTDSNAVDDFLKGDKS